MSASVLESARTMLADLISLGQTRFELFSVEDSFETAEGRKVVAQRSVTIGKTIGALTLIVLGSWLCAKLAQLAGWVAIRMFRQTPAYSNIIYRWTLALLVALLVVASLLAVQIPLTVFAFIGSWNDLWGPLIYLHDDSRFTMPLGLLNFIGTSGRAQGSPWHLVMAVSTVMMIPIVVLFFLAQKRFIEGIATSGVKG